MENIHGKETQLGDTGVYGTVGGVNGSSVANGYTPGVPPGDILGLFEENGLQVIR